MGFDFNGLAGKRLTPPASFFFILLFPYGSGQNSKENGLWKSEEPAICQRQSRSGVQPFIRRKNLCVNCTK
jgi:hypothetical protein